jgi:phospholipid/cholesterol/gamma-HCH transport system substrate-binding protein
MNRTVIDLWVGVFVAIGLACLLFLALKVGTANSIPQADSYQVTADFDNIGGLKVRAPVKSAGVVVGRVSRIDFDNQRYVAVVSLDLEKRYRFSTDSSAEILTSGLLGEQYIGLQGGALESNLKAGDKIKLTSSALVLEQLISKFLFSKAAEGGNSTQPASTSPATLK